MRTVRLYRATEATSPDFGFGTSWTPSLEHAVRYTTMPGYGGPAIYVAEVAVDLAEVLDLTGDAVAKLRRRGWDLPSQGEGEWLPGEIVRLGRLLGPGWGHRWWIWNVDEPGGGTSWLYLGSDPVPAARL
jgi:hypothetical protein